MASQAEASQAEASHAMNIIVLNSGSNGNAIYVESAASGKGILLDCGISRKQVETRLKIHGRFPTTGMPVFITHEHADHLRGLPAMCVSYHPRIYFTEPTFRHIWKRNDIKGFTFMENTATVEYEDLKVTAFPKLHDAADPVGFLVECGDRRFVYATDLGAPDSGIKALLPTVDAALIESNYDVAMLLAGDYPEWLKARVQSDLGHLSNAQAAALVEECCDGRLKTLIYGHLSANNNTAAAVDRETAALRQRKPDFNPHIIVASRETVGDILQV